MNVSHLMESYFKESPGFDKNLVGNIKESVPIKVPNEKSWDLLEEPEVLQRLFSFEKALNMVYFLEDVIQLQEQMSHHGKMLIDELQVLIQINTKVMNRVTDLDVEWTKKVDEIYKDVRTIQQ
jgi:pterin-4a-carbinolamine dehydratase